MTVDLWTYSRRIRKKSGNNVSANTKYESGKNSISAQMLQAIAEVLSVDVVALFPSHENLLTALHKGE